MLASVNLDPGRRDRLVGQGRRLWSGTTPWRSTAAEKSITGKHLTIETAAQAGEAATEGAAPLSMNGYKVPLTKSVVKRALLAAVGNRYWEQA